MDSILRRQLKRWKESEKFNIGQGALGVPFIASRKSIGPATILGVRLQAVF